MPCQRRLPSADTYLSPEPPATYRYTTSSHRAPIWAPATYILLALPAPVYYFAWLLYTTLSHRAPIDILLSATGHLYSTCSACPCILPYTLFLHISDFLYISHVENIFHMTICHVENFSTWQSVIWTNFSTWQFFSPRAPPVVPVTNMRYAVTRCVNHSQVHSFPVNTTWLKW